MNSDNTNWPKVSIVTVVYNSEKYIEATIKSVIAQNYPNLDFVIIDGGSEDSTMEIVNSYSDYISTIVTEEDEGIYNAMNKAKKYCEGNWMCFLNSGDLFFNDNVLLDIFNIVKKVNTDFVYGDTAYYSISEKYQYLEGKMVDENDFRFSFPICHQSMFFSKNIIDQMHWYNESFKVVADWDLVTRIFLEKKYKKLYVNLCVSKFLIDEMNWKNGVGSLWEWVLLTNKYRSKITTSISFVIFLVKCMRYILIINLKDYKIYSIYRNFKIKQIKASAAYKKINH